MLRVAHRFEECDEVEDVVLRACAEQARRHDGDFRKLTGFDVGFLHRFLRGCVERIRQDGDLVIGFLCDATGGDLGRWVQLSSTGVYGKPMLGEISEDSPTDPATAYETTKLAADALVLEAAARRNFSCVVVRPSNVYGSDMPNQSLFQLIDKIERGLFFYIGKPDAVVNYVHVENVVDALVLCGTASLSANGKTYIVSDHRPLEIFVGAIAAGLGAPSPRIRLPERLMRGVCGVAQGLPGFPLSLSRIDALTSRAVFRADRIQTELNFEHRISMEAGMRALAHAWKNRSIGA